MSQMWVWLVAGIMACVARAGAAAPAAPAAPVFVPVAHSAQLTLETASTPTELTLQLRPTQGTTPLAVTDLTVTVDGRNTAVTRRGDDTWSAAWPAGAGTRGGKLQVVVTHDGISEVLSGTLPGASAGTAVSGAAEAGRSSGGLRDHKQLAWWILNITVVLIAAIAISRRTS